MKPIYKYYLDGKHVDCPIGWEKWEDSISVDRTLKGLLVQSDVSLEFMGLGFQLLKSREDRGGQDELVSVRVEQLCSEAGDYNTIYNGTFFINQVDFDLIQCIAKCKMQDNGYYSKIYKNKSLEAYIETGKSKNEVSIQSVGRCYVKYLDPCTGIEPVSNLPTAWRVSEILRFLVRYMSDDEMDFYSSLFDVGGYWEFLTISQGKYIHVDGSAPSDDSGPVLSFELLLNELNSKDDLWFYVDTTKVKPTLVIERFDTLFTSKVVHKFANVTKLSTTYDITQMYAKVNFGSGEIKEKGDAVCSDACYFEEAIFIGCKDETFTILGKSNIDATLNLKGDFIVSPNIIQSIIYDNIQDFDDNFFFIDCKEVATTTPFVRLWANQKHILSSGSKVFNWRLMNNEVCDRYFRGIPNSIAKWIGDKPVRFKAVSSAQSSTIVLTSAPSTYEPVQFDNDYYVGTYGEGFDDSNQYGNGTLQGTTVSRPNSRFTAPSSSIYKLKATINLITTGSTNFTIHLKRYSSTGVFLNKISSPNKWNYQGYDTMVIEGSFLLDAGDYVIVAVESYSPVWAGYDWVVEGGSIFELTGSAVYSGIAKNQGTELYPVKKISSEDSLSCDDFNRIISARFSRLSVSNAKGLVLSGNIDSLKFNRLEGTVKINLMTTYK